MSHTRLPCPASLWLDIVHHIRINSGLRCLRGMQRLVVQETLGIVVEVGRTSSVGELIGITQTRDRVRTEHILHTLSKWLIISIEHAEILDHMREMLNRTIEEVVAGISGGETCRAIALQGHNRSSPACAHLLIEKAHPHGRVRVDPARK